MTKWPYAKDLPIRSMQMQPPLLSTPRLYFRRNQKSSLPASRSFWSFWSFLVVILPFFPFFETLLENIWNWSRLKRPFSSIDLVCLVLYPYPSNLYCNTLQKASCPAAFLPNAGLLRDPGCSSPFGQKIFLQKNPLKKKIKEFLNGVWFYCSFFIFFG